MRALDDLSSELRQNPKWNRFVRVIRSVAKANMCVGEPFQLLQKDGDHCLIIFGGTVVANVSTEPRFYFPWDGFFEENE